MAYDPCMAPNPPHGTCLHGMHLLGTYMIPTPGGQPLDLQQDTPFQQQWDGRLIMEVPDIEGISQGEKLSQGFPVKDEGIVHPGPPDVLYKLIRAACWVWFVHDVGPNCCCPEAIRVNNETQIRAEATATLRGMFMMRLISDARICNAKYTS